VNTLLRAHKTIPVSEMKYIKMNVFGNLAQVAKLRLRLSEVEKEALPGPNCLIFQEPGLL
jgi:hypothetical protein